MAVPVLTSPALTELTQKRDALSVKAKASKANKVRLGKLLYPQWVNETVVRVTDVEAPTAAFIGLKPRRDQVSVVATESVEPDEAAIRARTLAGESLADMPSIKEQLEKENRQYAAYEDAISHLDREIERERDRLNAEYSKSLEPKHDEQMRKLLATALDMHTAWFEIHSMKHELIDSGIGLRNGLYLTLPEFLPNPSDPYSQMADWFRAVKAAGYIKEVPASLRMKAYR
jgi:hypothetical protein